MVFTKLQLTRSPKLSKFVSLFYDAFSVTGQYSVNDLVISEMMIKGKEFGRKRSWPNLRHYADIHLHGLEKPRKTSISTAGRPGRDLNMRPLEAGVLPTRPRWSVLSTWTYRRHSVDSGGSWSRIFHLKNLWDHYYKDIIHCLPQII
jgi:hypothetical protein